MFVERESGRSERVGVSARLALIAALALIATGGTAFWLQRRSEIRGAQGVARAKATLVANAVLRPALRPQDLGLPVTPVRRRELDNAFSHLVLANASSLRATIYNAHGTVVYSTNHALIGQTRPLVPLLAAEQTDRLEGSLPMPPGQRPPKGGQVVESFVPFTLGPGNPGGALELDQRYAPIAGPSVPLLLPLTVLIGLVILGLFLTLLPVLRRLDKREKAQKGRMKQMEKLAFHDALTGLPNRTLFRDRVEQALRNQDRDGGAVAVMLMDLDRFKEINDTFGHQSGDELLEEVGVHLRRALRSNDTIARLGGDEFAILAPSVAGPLGAVALAERALEEVQRTHKVAGVEVDVDASIGIALCPHHGDDVDSLLRCADIAMYAAKTCGAPTLYAIQHDHHSADRLALGAQLRRAITQRELIVHYQPKVDFDSGEITSVEALVRWEHAEHGLLPPDLFIPLAEQSGLIRALTSYVLDMALAQCSAWRKEGLNIAVAVNITGRDLLDQRFAEEVKDLLRKWEVKPSRLELEITENTVLTDPARARTVLMTLSELGVRLAIDDFGSGNSSLGYFKRLPINVLKIDKSFVLQMHSNADDAAIVRSTIDLGHNLGLKVVAEGVNSLTAYHRLRQLGCDFAQGYYLSRPVPGEELGRMLTAFNEAPRAAGDALAG